MSTDYPGPVFIEPDYRYFIKSGQTREETIDFVSKVLKEFGNDPECIFDFMYRVYNSQEVVFAFIYGSALNFNLDISEIEDVDVIVATRNKKFVYAWDRPKGTEIRYMPLSELKSYLTLQKRFFLPVFSKEYNYLGGIFANGLLAIKFSKELENIIHGVRQNFQTIQVKALSQIVENDCKKRVAKSSRSAKTKRHVSSQEGRRYAFYGSEYLISFDEVRLMIDESIKRKNIQPGKAPAIARRILKRIKASNVYASQRFLL